MKDTTDPLTAPTRIPEIVASRTDRDAPPVVSTAGADDDACDEGRRPIMTIFMSTMENAMEAMEAADMLGLGVSVQNRLVPDNEPDTHCGDWVVDLFVEPTVVGE